jgi:uncharacterized protein YxeA
MRKRRRKVRKQIVAILVMLAVTVMAALFLMHKVTETIRARRLQPQRQPLRSRPRPKQKSRTASLR